MRGRNCTAMVGTTVIARPWASAGRRPGRPRAGRRFFATILPAIAACAGMGWPMAAMAQPSVPSGRHGDGHAQHHDWYKDLRQPDTGSRCCRGDANGQSGDCRPAPAVRDADGTYRVWDGRTWLVVPRSKIIVMPTPDGGTHLCETYGRVFCFIIDEDKRGLPSQ